MHFPPRVLHFSVILFFIQMCCVRYCIRSQQYFASLLLYVIRRRMKKKYVFPSYGDILPTLSAEKWVSVVSMLWGVVLFGYILGGLASTLTTSDAQRARYIHRLNVIRDHLVSLLIHTYTVEPLYKDTPELRTPL